MIFLDTDVLIWLASGEVDRLSAVARQSIESEPVVISPRDSLWLAFFREIGRLGVEPHVVVDLVRKSLGLAIVSHELVDVASGALPIERASRLAEQAVIALIEHGAEAS